MEAQMKRHKYLVWLRGALAFGLAFGAFLAVGGASAQTPALVSVSPEYQLVGPRQEFSVQVRIDDAAELYAFDVLLSFPPDLFEVLTVTDENFLTPGLGGDPFIDNEAGTVNVIHAQMNPAEPVSGGGVLFTVVFLARGASASADLLIGKAELSDRDGFLLACETRGGAVRLGDYALFLPALYR